MSPHRSALERLPVRSQGEWPLPNGPAGHTLSLVETEVAKYGSEPVAETEPRRRMLWLMAEYFKMLGYTELKARLPGYIPPVVLSGTLEDHRPDLSCRQSNIARTPTLLEVVPAEELDDPRMEHRWTLLSSAAKLYGAELHFAVPKWCVMGPGDRILKRRLDRLEVAHQRVWVV